MDFVPKQNGEIGHAESGRPRKLGVSSLISRYRSHSSGDTGFNQLKGPPTLRRKLYEQLEPTARTASGLSATNRLLIVLIIAAAGVAIIETEPTVSQGQDQLFRALELVFGIIFLLEYATRIWIAVEHPRFCTRRFPRLRYPLTPAALADLIAIVPALLAFGGGGTLVLRIVRMARLLRLAKLGRMSRAWRHVAEAIRSRRFELGLTLAIAAAALLASSTVLYWVEGDAQPEEFGSIPRSLWWAVATLTTVGYGDAVPITALGRLLSSIVAVVGIALIALPTGILAAAFSDALQRQREGAKGELGEPDAGAER